MRVITTGLEIKNVPLEIGKEFEVIKELYPELSDDLINEAIELGHKEKKLIPIELSDGTILPLISRKLTVDEYLAFGPEQRKYDLANRDTKPGEEDYQPYCMCCSSMARSTKTEYGFCCPSCKNKTNISMYGLRDPSMNRNRTLIIDYSSRAEDPIRRASKLRKILEDKLQYVDISYMEQSNELGYLLNKKGNSYVKIYVVIPSSMKMNGNYSEMTDSLYGSGLEVKEKITFVSMRHLQDNIGKMFF